MISGYSTFELTTPDAASIHIWKKNGSTKDSLIFLHGGPGLSCGAIDFRLLSDTSCDTYLYDQRGCGLSKELDYLPTPDQHISDLLLLLDKYEIDKAVLYGGSWGATLAMLFAIKHPDRVERIILRSLYPATAAATRYYCGGQQPDQFEQWKKLTQAIPETHHQDVSPFLYEVLSESDFAINEKYASLWMDYVNAIFGKTDDIPITRKLVKKLRLEMQYAANRCFVDEGYLLSNTDQVAHIPITAIHGNDNQLIPYRFVQNLYSQLPLAEVHLVEGGHAASDYQIWSTSRDILKAL